MASAPFKAFKNCKGPNSADKSAQNNINPGFGEKVLLNRGNVKTTVMPWIAASGAPGRVAVAYYGTSAEGNPDSGSFSVRFTGRLRR